MCAEGQAVRQTDRLTGGQAHRQTDRQTDMQRQAHRHTCRQTDGQAHGQADTQTPRRTHTLLASACCVGVVAGLPSPWSVCTGSFLGLLPSPCGPHAFPHSLGTFSLSLSRCQLLKAIAVLFGKRWATTKILTKADLGRTHEQWLQKVRWESVPPAIRSQQDLSPAHTHGLTILSSRTGA
jgi:hypothetical protein